MSAARLSCEGIILGKIPSGECHLRLQIFSAKEGPLQGLLRLRSPGKPGPRPPDLFDLSHLELERSSRGNLYFVKEIQSESPFTRIGSHYQTLVDASAFANTVWKNLPHAEHFEEMHRLLLRSLESFSAGERPDVTHFKSLFLLARAEGYPVKEQMLAGWSPSNQNSARQILSQPVNGDQPDADTVRRLLENMQLYLQRYTDILI